jgi:thioesterase domain-containing protein
MNDYLKNQLGQGEHFGRRELSRNEREEREVKMLRVEVEYLKELNREKELEIEFLRQKERRKKSLFTEVTQESYSSSKKLSTNHRRQVSAKLTTAKKGTLNCSVRPSNSNTKMKCRLCYE